MDKKKRQTLLALGSIAVAYVAIRNAPALLPERLVLEPLETPDGFRIYRAGESSSAFNAFAGLESAEEAAQTAARREAAQSRVERDICGALYGELSLKSGQIPLASFSDYYCPFCRVQTKRLAELVKSKPDEVAVAWHELPLLGEASDKAARAALAAKRQGAYVAFHDRLMRSAFRASDAYLADLARNIGVDHAQLVADMESSETTQELDDSAALSRIFAFVGTPALVIGRTVIQGQVSDKMIAEIIDLEREEGWDVACTVA